VAQCYVGRSDNPSFSTSPGALPAPAPDQTQSARSRSRSSPRTSGARRARPGRTRRVSSSMHRGHPALTVRAGVPVRALAGGEGAGARVARLTPLRAGGRSHSSLVCARADDVRGLYASRWTWRRARAEVRVVGGACTLAFSAQMERKRIFDYPATFLLSSKDPDVLPAAAGARGVPFQCGAAGASHAQDGAVRPPAHTCYCDRRT
jgi:hypothetical protein